MKQEFKLGSKYTNITNALNTLEDKEYITSSDGCYYKVTLDENDKYVKIIEFEGGPILSVGDVLEGIGEVTEIKSTYLIKFK